MLNNEIKFNPLFNYEVNRMSREVASAFTTLTMDELTLTCANIDAVEENDAEKHWGAVILDLRKTLTGELILSHLDELKEKVTVRAKIFLVAQITSDDNFVPAYADLYLQTLKFILGDLSDKGLPDVVDMRVIANYFPLGFPCHTQMMNAWDDLKKFRNSNPL